MNLPRPPCGVTQAILHIYDLKGTESTNNTTLGLGMGIFHAGVEVFGVEWSYGFLDIDPEDRPVSGVYPVRPRKCPIGTFRESVHLGPVRAHSARDVWRLLGSLAGEWLGCEYHPLRHNCLTFCEDLINHLGVQTMPAWVGRLAAAADVLLTPLLDALDIPMVPVRPPPSLEDGDAGPQDHGFAQSLARRRRRSSRLSVVTAVALDFEKRFAWAITAMLVFEGRLHAGLRVRSPAEASETPRGP